MNMRHAAAGVLLLVATFLLTGAADSPAWRVTAPAITVLTDRHSEIKKPGYRRIDSAAEWRQVWLAHLGVSLNEDTRNRAHFEVDFEQCFVVAIFGGPNNSSCGYRVEEVEETQDHLRLRFSNNWFQTTAHGVDSAAPFAFIVLRKSDKPIVLEETSYSLRGEHSTREVARLTAHSGQTGGGKSKDTD